MRIRYGCEITFRVEAPTPVYCMVDVHPDRRVDILDERPLSASPRAAFNIVYDTFGNLVRRFTAPVGETTLNLSGSIEDNGALDHRDHDARVVPVCELPPEAMQYLGGSRYCETDRLSAIAWNNFGHLQRDMGLVEAVCDFVHRHLTFDYAHARNTRTALEAFVEHVGVCRDFTHLAIALCRCLNIPARYVNGYLGDIGIPASPAPMDFNAWFEAYLGGRWYTFDARHNQRRIGRIPIARGRDACDVPMLQTFGRHELVGFKVTTFEEEPLARHLHASARTQGASPLGSASTSRSFAAAPEPTSKRL